MEIAKNHENGYYQSTGNSEKTLKSLFPVNIDIYYMHKKEIWRFLNKLKAIITFGLRRFISSKEIFLPSRFYFSNAIVLCQAREHLSHADVFFLTSRLCDVNCLSTTFRMQDVRLGVNVEMKTT